MSALGRMSWQRAAAATPVAIVAGLGIAVNGAAAGLLGLTVLCLVALRLLVTRLSASYGARFRPGGVLRWTMAAFAGHLVLSILLNAVLYSTTDARVYHRDALAILRHWHGGFPAPVLPNGKEGFYYLLAGIFWLFGTHNLAGLIVNAAFAAALVPLATDLTHRLMGDEAARYVPWLVVLLPGMLLWTSQLLKEPPIIFLVAVCISCAARLLTRITFSGLATLAASLAVLFTMRSHVGLALAVGILIGMAFGRPSVLGGIAAGLSAAAVMAVLVTSTGLGYSGYKSATGSNLKQANVVRKDLAQSANSGFGTDVDISTPSGALTSLPVAAATFLAGPFPWQFGGGHQLVALPDVVVWWLLLPSLGRGLKAAWRRIGRASLIMILPAAITTALLSIVVGNFGTIVRERSQVVMMLVPFLALGLAERAARTAPLREGDGTKGVGGGRIHDMRPVGS